MIKTFGNKLATHLFDGESSKETRSFPPELHAIALRKLAVLNRAVQLEDLRIPPGNRLEKLSGHLATYHSIRINEQWRIIFEWAEDGARNVEIVDYH